jgi:hypothetical protein
MLENNLCRSLYVKYIQFFLSNSNDIVYLIMYLAHILKYRDFYKFNYQENFVN